jgi:hypothetical protein
MQDSKCLLDEDSGCSRAAQVHLWERWLRGSNRGTANALVTAAVAQGANDLRSHGQYHALAVLLIECSYISPLMQQDFVQISSRVLKLFELFIVARELYYFICLISIRSVVVVAPYTICLPFNFSVAN